MKKLSLMIMLFMGISIIAPSVYADDDLGELSELMGGLDDGSDAGNDDMGEDLNDSDMDDDTTTDTSDDKETKKVVLKSVSQTDDSMKVSLTPIEDYSTYKVYYTKSGSGEVSEKSVETSGTGDVEVEINDLSSNTSYTVIAKAFNEEGDPIEATASETLTVKTKEAEVKHQAPADNVIYNPTVKVYDKKIVVSYKPGVDVKKVQISMSEDSENFKPVAVVDATTTTYEIPVEKAGKKYIKLVPVAEDSTLGVCKIGATEVKFIPTEEPKKEAPKHIGKAKTGPELYFLVILAVLAYVVYARRKIKA